MLIDNEYVENKIVKLNEDGSHELTHMGRMYGIVAILSILKTNLGYPPKYIKDLEICEVPNNITIQPDISHALSDVDMNWIMKYISSHKYNQSIHQATCEIILNNKCVDKYFVEAKATHIKDMEFISVNSQYVENKLLTIDENHVFHLTALGRLYGLALVIIFTGIEINAGNIREEAKDVEICKIPKRIMECRCDGEKCENSNGYRLTQKGVNWTVEYMSKHRFNSYVYNMATSLSGGE